VTRPHAASPARRRETLYRPAAARRFKPSTGAERLGDDFAIHQRVSATPTSTSFSSRFWAGQPARSVPTSVPAEIAAVKKNKKREIKRKKKVKKFEDDFPEGTSPGRPSLLLLRGEQRIMLTCRGAALQSQRRARGRSRPVYEFPMLRRQRGFVLVHLRRERCGCDRADRGLRRQRGKTWRHRSKGYEALKRFAPGGGKMSSASSSALRRPLELNSPVGRRPRLLRDPRSDRRSSLACPHHRGARPASCSARP